MSTPDLLYLSDWSSVHTTDGKPVASVGDASFRWLVSPTGSAVRSPTGQAVYGGEVIYTEVGTATIQVTGFAPTFGTGATSAPEFGQLYVYGFPPDVTAPLDKSKYIVSPTERVMVSPQHHGVYGGYHVSQDIGTAQISVTGYAPDIVIPAGDHVPAAVIAVSGYAPTIGGVLRSASGEAIRLPTGSTLYVGDFFDSGAVEFSPEAFTVAVSGADPFIFSAAPSTPEFFRTTAGGYLYQPDGQPILATMATSYAIVQPYDAEVSVTGYAPILDIPAATVIDECIVTVTGYAPSVGVAGIADPATATIDVTGQTPTVATSGNTTVPFGEISVTGYAPVIGVPWSDTPAESTIDVTGPAPGVVTSIRDAVALTDGSYLVTPDGEIVILPTTPLGIAWAEPADAAVTVSGQSVTVTAIAPIDVIPDRALIEVSGENPTISAAVSVDPAAAEVSVTGFASAIETPVAVEPTSADVEVSGYEPTVGAAVSVDVPAADISVSGYEPTVTAAIIAAPDAGTVSVSGFAPSVEAAVSVNPDRSLIEVSGGSVSIAAMADAWPDAGAVSVSGFAPTIDADVSVLPDRSLIEVQGQQASVSTITDARPDYASISVSGPEPFVVTSLSFVPDTAVISVTGIAPQSIGANVGIIVPAAAGSVTGFVPIVAAPVDARPAGASVEISGYEPTVTAATAAAPDTGTIAVSGAVPSVVAVADARPGVGDIEVSSTAPSVAISDTQRVWPLAASILVAAFGVSVLANVSCEPAAASIHVVGQDASLLAGSGATPDVGLINVTGPAPDIVGRQWQFIRPAFGAIEVTGYDPVSSLGPVLAGPAAAAVSVSGHAATVSAITPISRITFRVPRPQQDFMVSTLTGHITKHQWSELRISVDWGQHLTALGTSLATSEWVEVTNTGLLLVDPFVAFNKASVEVGGGVDETTALLENRVTFVDGTRDVYTITVTIGREV